MVRLLLEAGSDIRYVSSNGYSVLVDVMYSQASEGAMLSMVDYLIGEGADVQRMTNYNESPIQVASHRGRFDIIRRLVDAGADLEPLGWNDLMMAVAFGNDRDVLTAASRKNDLTQRDCYSRTPWLLCVQTGDIKKAQILVSAGATIDDRDRIGQTALSYAVEQNDDRMVAWLLALGTDVWQAEHLADHALIQAAENGATECVKLLLAAGADVTFKNEFDDSAMSVAAEVDIVRLLISTGQEWSDANAEVKRRLVGLEPSAELEVSEADYRTGKRPRFGNANPELMEVPFWHAMIRAGCSAWSARERFDDPQTPPDGPIWCLQRFGSSFTELPDGMFVQIGGEHEDFYDPDFCIYNDVIVYRGKGEFQILGYPEGVFPPTDFHSATYVDGSIYVIGRLGYSGTRDYGHTPVYRLNCDTWQMECVRTSGELPGWVHEHRARLIDHQRIVLTGGRRCVEIDGQEQIVSNSDVYQLDLPTMTWQRMVSTD
jgi:ankyrin repeat protein